MRPISLELQEEKPSPAQNRTMSSSSATLKPKPDGQVREQELGLLLGELSSDYHLSPPAKSSIMHLVVLDARLRAVGEQSDGRVGDRDGGDEWPSPEDTADALARNLRRLRAERGLTLDELAKRAGVSRSMLIQIEQKRVNPTLATLVRLAQALDVGLAELVELGSRRRVRVISRDDVAELWTSPGGGSGRLLVGSDQLDHVEFWDWRLEPKDVHEAEAHLPGTAELLHVLEGDLTLEVDGEAHAATAGESDTLLGRRRPLLRQQRHAAPARAHGRHHAPGREDHRSGERPPVRRCTMTLEAALIGDASPDW